MFKKKYIPVNYTSRDFNSLRQELYNYARKYYPESIADFSEASFGALMLDSVAYTGDLLSYYLDYQYNESLLTTANDYDNLLKIARQYGYKYNGAPSATGKVALYAVVPANQTGLGPNSEYIPIVKTNSSFSSNNGSSFLLTEDVRFDGQNNEVVAARVDPATGLPTYYAIKSYGNVVSGYYQTQDFAVGSFERFKTITINDFRVAEIVKIVDSAGNEYIEVDNLSQDIVYKSVINTDPLTRKQAPYLMIQTPVPRRFITEKTTTSFNITFGHGSETMFYEKDKLEPRNIAINRFARDYVTDSLFDPMRLTTNEQFGIAPENTTLRITYRINSVGSNTVAPGNLNKNVNVFLDFPNNRNISDSVRNTIASSIEVFNEESINFADVIPSLEDIRRSTLDHYASQARAVTAQDYESLCYNMPSKFGMIKRVRALRDEDSLKRNINIYVLSSNSGLNLEKANDKTKSNLKTWISKYKMANDNIEILDARIVNVGIEYEIVVEEPYNRFEVLQNTITVLRNSYSNYMFIGQPFNIYDIYSLLNKVDGVSDIRNVKIVNKNGSNYSSDYINLLRYTSSDGRKIIPPYNVVLEVKFPNSDIIGSIA